MVDCTQRNEVENIFNVYGNLACLSPITMWVIVFIFAGLMLALLTILRKRSTNPTKGAIGRHKSLEVIWIYFIVLTCLSFLMMLFTHFKAEWIRSQIFTVIIIIVSVIVLSYVAQYVFQKKGIYNEPEPVVTPAKTTP